MLRCLISLILALWAFPVAASEPPRVPIERGRTIYTIGVDGAGGEIVARTAGIELTGAAAACAACHRHPLDGGGEGGVRAPALAWPRLTERKAGYDLTALTAALADGHGVDGRTLHVLMPRYALTPGQLGDLAAYLRSDHAPPGVTDQEIAIATIIPANPALRPAALAVAAVLEEKLAQPGAPSAIFGRRLRLQTLDAALPFETLTAQLARDPPALVIASVGLDEHGPVAEELTRREILNFAPLAGLTGLEPRERILPLRPGLARQAAMLVRQMQSAHGCFALSAGSDPISAAVAQELALHHAPDPQCPARLVLSPPSTLVQVLGTVPTDHRTTLYALAEQLGTGITRLAARCTLTVASASNSGLEDSARQNAADAAEALQAALAASGRVLSPGRLHASLSKASALPEPHIRTISQRSGCDLSDL